MKEHRIKVSEGKYEFVNRGACDIDVLRHGQSWIECIDGPNAIASLMYELDAARVVLEAARTYVAVETLNGRGDDCKALARALETHDGCVGEHQPRPTSWARSYCLCSGGDDGGHEPDCDRRVQP